MFILLSQAGAKFVHFTSKHCDGYERQAPQLDLSDVAFGPMSSPFFLFAGSWTHWRSSAKPNYNSVDAGPMRDIVGELTNATRAAGLRMGLYYCKCVCR